LIEVRVDLLWCVREFMRCNWRGFEVKKTSHEIVKSFTLKKTTDSDISYSLRVFGRCFVLLTHRRFIKRVLGSLQFKTLLGEKCSFVRSNETQCIKSDALRT
jgi:hypothetical protein